MTIQAFDLQHDVVINSHFLVCKTSYENAIDNLVPLIDRLDQQRNTLPSHYYKKLEKDIKTGCIMPALTLALVLEETLPANIKTLEEYVNTNIENAFVLDGIQRLNTLRRIGKANLERDRPIYVNFLVCNSMDKLLYRMITLNNGQKPMSARHQVEILASNIYKFEDLDINLVSEKEQKKKVIKGGFKKSDVIRAYLAFISDSINIDNQKIIESKLDELITDQIIESDLTERSIEFSDVIEIINKYTENKKLLEWFGVANNLIGFGAGIKKTFEVIQMEEHDNFLNTIVNFEEAFSYIDVSKIKLGMARRRAVQHLIENYSRLKEYSVNKITNEISQEI